ncbi:MAG TPA: hypothetical protein VL382_10300 [Terriglobales bacterium]|nr:hypothetical protein [Terriglobales bacterium]
MSRSLGFIGLIIVVAVGAVIYMKQVQSAAPGAAEGGGNPRSTIDIAGVKNDLIGIGNAERQHMATQGKYASLDELVAAGELQMARTSRGNWHYASETSESGFKITATYSGDAPAGTPTRFTIDETMQVRSE